MAAATADGVASKLKDLDGRTLDAFAREIIENTRVQGLVIPYGNKESIPPTSLDDINDIFRLSRKWPAGTVLWDFSGTPSAMDGGAGLVYDIVWVDEAGAVVLTVVSASTKGQAASGSDVAAAAARGRLVGAGYLAMKVTTAATTPAAGTYNFGMLVSLGWTNFVLLGPGDSTVYLKDARA